METTGNSVSFPTRKCCRKKWGERMGVSQVSVSLWDRPPSEGPWLPTGKSSRASGSKVKTGLCRERLHRQSVGRLRRRERPGPREIHTP